jgi:hypothetical protein
MKLIGFFLNILLHLKQCKNKKMNFINKILTIKTYKP